MERIMSVEEKIRRAEEIYQRRQEGNLKRTATVNIMDNNKKDIKLLKKMVIQIIICLIIYFVIYIINNSNLIFSKDFINKANQLLSYDTNFSQVYKKMKESFIELKNKNVLFPKTNEINNNNVNNLNEISNISERKIENNIDNTISNNEVEKIKSLTPEEIDIAKIKDITTFIKPIEGQISSKYGTREPTTKGVPKNHTGVDIAANIGTKIKSSTDGEVVLTSSEGDYGKHIKIKIGDVSIIYAHCNNIYVKQGDMIKQGQEIAEVRLYW